MLGFLHFRHLGPKPCAFSYPYPEFTQVVFRAVAVEKAPEEKLPDDYEIEAEFRPVSEVRGLDPAPAGRPFLDAAMPPGRGR